MEVGSCIPRIAPCLGGWQMGVTNATYKGFEGYLSGGVSLRTSPFRRKSHRPASRFVEHGKTVIRLGSTSHRHSGLRDSPGQLGIGGLRMQN